jgi:protein gp37
MNKTKIEYLDYTLNIIVGCSGIDCVVCPKCWARLQAKRRKGKCKDDRCYRFAPHDHPERLDEPLHVQKPSRIGLNFSGETFDKNLDNRELIWRGTCGMMRRTPWHTFIVLTKQPQNIPEDENFPLPPNLWLGVTVNCKADLWRIDELRKTSATVKCVSFEPIYEDLGEVNLEGIDWIIIGAQTRPEVQPNPTWTARLFRQAHKNKIPFFIKNNIWIDTVLFCDLKSLGYSAPFHQLPTKTLSTIT